MGPIKLFSATFKVSQCRALGGKVAHPNEDFCYSGQARRRILEVSVKSGKREEKSEVSGGLFSFLSTPNPLNQATGSFFYSSAV
ncbi:hypothetical protein TNCV_192041 [Trichonephila clavipes]|nr:hypothetical protein TNCV_192041 [Trichonephila clavipes]